MANNQHVISNLSQEAYDALRAFHMLIRSRDGEKYRLNEAAEYLIWRGLASVARDG